jgi:hypothetical protein
MKKKVSQIEKSKHFSGSRTVVTYDEIKEWVSLWREIREKVASNLEAFKELSGKGLRYRDYRTIQRHLEGILPLIDNAPVSALIDFINFCESRFSIMEFMMLIREKLPMGEVGPRLDNLAGVLIGHPIPLGQVIQAFGSILSGGFPFDATSIRK